jgi:hypothetical protein
MADNAYRALPGANWSTLKNILVSPRAYIHACNTTITPTPAMEFGTAVHLAVLEGEEFTRRQVVVPDEYLTGSGGISTSKAAREWQSGLPVDALLLTPTQAVAIMMILSRIDGHRGATSWLKQADQREQPVQWTDDDTGTVCKACPDAYGNGLLLDLKTWSPRGEFTPDAFMREALSRRYLGQLGYYMKGLAHIGIEIARLGFLVVQSVAPHDVMCIELDVDATDYALREADDALAALHEWRENGGEDEGAAPDIVTMGLPAWAARSRNNQPDTDDVGF